MFVQAEDTVPIAWSKVRAAIAETICLVEEPAMPSGYVPSYGHRDRCGLEDATSPLDQAVVAAFAEASPLLVTVLGVFDVSPPEIETLFAAEDSIERQRLVAEAYLGHEPFLHTLLPRLEGAMAARGLACDGCPDVELPEIRRKTWAEFSPYVSAFILPHADATQFHVCSGVDAAKRVDDPEPNLLRSGFLAAFQSPSTRQVTFEILAEHQRDEAFLETDDDKERVEFLHAIVVERFRDDPDVRREACAALQPYIADLGLEVVDCPHGEARPDRAAHLGHPVPLDLKAPPGLRARPVH
jgi:hypothetical protein